MESKELKEELKESFKIYKIAGVVIVILLLIGILYAVFTREKAPVLQTMPTPVEPAAPVETPVENATTPAENITQNITEIPQNITRNATPSITVPENKTQPFKQVNYTWESVRISFPDTLKKIPIGVTSHEYIEILEADNTPITNGEQFDLSFIIDDRFGKQTDLIATFEKGKWLISILFANTGNYTLTVTAKCEEKKGYCQKFYTAGSAQNSTVFEIV